MLFTWPQIALALLQLANIILGEEHDRRQFGAGVDSQIAKEALAIAKKTAAGKAIMERVNALSEADVDKQLAGLEPK